MGSIDIHSHAFPESFLRRISELHPDQIQLDESGDVLIGRWSKAPLPAFDLHTRKAEMDRDDVDLEFLSAPIVYGITDRTLVELCRRLNGFQAQMCNLEPDRFRSFLHLPVHDLRSTQAELTRWRDVPSVVGVVLGSNMGGTYPGDAALLPVWELIAESRLPVFIHPLGPCGMPPMPVMSPIFMFPNDTAVAAASIIYSGLMQRFPELDIILAHYGGPLSVLARRLDMGYENRGFAPGHGENFSQPPSSFLSRFYVDCAQGFHGPGLDAARAVFGIEHILFGSDQFLLGTTWRAQLNEFLYNNPRLSDADLHAILRGNAERLFHHRLTMPQP